LPLDGNQRRKEASQEIFLSEKATLGQKGGLEEACNQMPTWGKNLWEWKGRAKRGQELLYLRFLDGGGKHGDRPEITPFVWLIGRGFKGEGGHKPFIGPSLVYLLGGSGANALVASSLRLEKWVFHSMGGGGGTIGSEKATIKQRIRSKRFWLEGEKKLD